MLMVGIVRRGESGAEWRTGWFLTMAVAGLAAWFLLGGPAGTLPHVHADVIHLIDGRKVVGEILVEDEYRVKVKLKHGTMTIDRDDIFEIERRKEPADLHAEELAKATSADELVALAERAREWGLDDTVVRGDLEKALELDPDHVGAHEALGHKQKDGGWLSEEEWRIAEGYVLVDGEWLKGDVAARRRSKSEERARRRIEKGTASYRDEIEGVPWARAWKVESPHYVLRSNAGKTDELTRKYSNFLEMLYTKLSSVFRRLPIYYRRPSDVYILRNQQEFLDINIGLMNNPGIGGYYVPGVLPATGKERVLVAYHGQFGESGNTYGVLAHEGTHQFEHRMMKGEFMTRPIWLIEGLAVLIGDGHRVKGRKIEIGIPRDRLAVLQRAIRADSYRKLKDLIRLPQATFGGFEYAHAWGLIYYMLFSKEPFVYAEKEIQLSTVFESYLRDNLEQAAPAERFEQLLGGAAVLEALEEEWKKYILELELESLGRTRSGTFTSKTLSFKASRPGRDWTILEDLELRYGENFACENLETTGRMSVVSQPNGMLFDAKGLAERLAFSLNGRLDEAVLKGRTEVVVKGHEAVVLDYIGREKPTTEEQRVRSAKQRFKRYVLTTAKRFYLVTFQADEERFEECQEAFDNALEKFEILLQ